MIANPLYARAARSRMFDHLSSVVTLLGKPNNPATDSVPGRELEALRAMRQRIPAKPPFDQIASNISLQKRLDADTH